MAETKLPLPVEQGLPMPTIETIEALLKIKLNPKLWEFVLAHKTHCTDLVVGPPNYEQFGPQGMRTDLKHTLIVQRLFPKMSLAVQAERADGVCKANVANLAFNISQMMALLTNPNISNKDLNITAAANAAHMMLYSTEEYGRRWCLIYQLIMQRHINAILKNKRLPTVSPKIKSVQPIGSSTHKAKR